MIAPERKKHVLDATNQSIGRLATRAALLLMGKNKPTYRPEADLGDSVIVENIKNAKFTGNKLANKIYHRHTAHPGGIRTNKMSEIWGKNPAEVMRRAVYNMLPKNRLRPGRMKRLKIQ